MFGQAFNSGFFSAPCFTDTTDIFKDRSGVALYTLDYDASDSGGATGKFGEGAVFNGTSSYIDTGGSMVNSLTSITLSAWVYTEPNTNYSYVMHVGDVNAAGDAFSISRWNSTASGGYDAYTVYANIGAGNVDGNYVLNENTWYHVAVTWEGTTIKFYVDGNLTNTVTTSSLSINATGNSGYIGRYMDNQSYNWKGKIDQVRIFNKALTSSEVTTLYNENKNTTSTLQILGDTSCIATYKLDGNSIDLSGNYDGTDANIIYKYDGTPTAVDFGVGGKSNYGARFNGSSSYIDSNYTLPADSTMSFSMWLNQDTHITGLNGIFSDYDSAGANINSRLTIALYTNNSLYINIGNGTSYWSDNSISMSSYIGAWMHLCITINGTAVKVYINGGAPTNLTSSVAFGSVGARNHIIGRSGELTGSGRYYKGDIDQVRIFNKALNSTEVSKLYGNGAGEIACKYKATTTDVNYPAINTAYYKLDNNAKSSNAAGHYLFIGDAGQSNSSGRLNSIDSEFTYTRPAGYSEWGGSWDPNNKAGSATQTFEENNKKWTKSGTYYNGVWSTNQYSSGKYYAEIEFLGIELLYGISKLTSATGFNTNLQNNSIFYGSWATSSWKYSTTNTSEGVVLSTNDVIGLAADFDNQILTVYRNNVLFDTVSIAGHDGTETDVEYRFGRYGQAGVFNGSSSKIDTGFAQNTSNAFSWSLWFNADTSSGINMLIDTTSNSSPYPGCGIGHANGAIAGFIAGTTGNLTYSGETISTNEWHHTVLTYDGSGSFKLYLDSVEVGSGTHSLNLNSSQNILIGNSAVSTWPGHPGKIDQVRVFSSALSSDQVTKLYNEKPETDTSTFKTVLYTGDGGTQYISNVGFEPDLVWVKNRDASSYHYLYNTVSEGHLYSDSAAAQDANSTSSYGYILPLANGFDVYKGSVTSSNGTNYSGNDYVAWCWKAGGPAISNTDGSITSQVSANTASGFSIVKYTGNGTAGATVGHGLSSPPDFIIVKLLDNLKDWYVFSELLGQSGGEYQYLELNDTAAANTFNTQQVWNGVLPTSDVFTLTAGSADNTNNNDYIAYCFHSVSGVSKVGSYTGAGSGTRVYTTSDGTSTGTGGFKPSWVMLKNASVGGTGYDWYIYDVRRDDGDGDDNLESYLAANTSAAEVTSNTGSNGIVMEDDGFTLDIAATAINGSGNTFIYMAFK